MPAKRKARTPHSECAHKKAHPDHHAVLPRLRRAEGQLRGIADMIASGRYCVDILTQIRAASAALRSVEAQIFQTHLKSCVNDALSSKDPAEAEEKVEELIELLLRRGN